MAKPTATEHVRISHLLIWITMSAVYIVAFRGLQFTWRDGISLSIQAISTGLVWTGACVVICQMVKGQQSIEPGSWLVFCLGVIFLLEAITRLWPREFLVVPEPVAQALICVALAIPTLSTRLEMKWKWLFVLLVLLQVAILSLAAWKSRDRAFSSPIQIELVDRLWLAVGALMPPLITSWTWKGIRQFSWLHWVGVIFFSFWCATNLLWKLLK